jgi:hypothetical protein
MSEPADTLMFVDLIPRIVLQEVQAAHLFLRVARGQGEHARMRERSRRRLRA